MRSCIFVAIINLYFIAKARQGGNVRLRRSTVIRDQSVLDLLRGDFEQYAIKSRKRSKGKFINNLSNDLEKIGEMLTDLRKKDFQNRKKNFLINIRRGDNLFMDELNDEQLTKTDANTIKNKNIISSVNLKKLYRELNDITRTLNLADRQERSEEKSNLEYKNKVIVGKFNRENKNVGINQFKKGKFESNSEDFKKFKNEKNQLKTNVNTLHAAHYKKVKENLINKALDMEEDTHQQERKNDLADEADDANINRAENKRNKDAIRDFYNNKDYDHIYERDDEQNDVDDVKRENEVEEEGKDEDERAVDFEDADQNNEETDVTQNVASYVDITKRQDEDEEDKPDAYAEQTVRQDDEGDGDAKEIQLN